MARAYHIGSLESVRGIAALTVCLFHAGVIPYQGKPIVQKEGWLNVLLNGHGAVILFFVLSGFVLRAALGRRAAGESAAALARDFIVARIFRLFPVIVAAVAVLLCAEWLVRGVWPQPGVFLRNALLLETIVNGAFWTLQVEVFGSLLVLAAIILERRFGLWTVYALTGGLLLLSFTGSTRILWHAVDTGFFYAFLFGYLVATLRRPVFRSESHAVLALCATLVVFYAAHSYGNVLRQWLLLATAASAALIVLVLSERGFRGLMQAAPLRLLGLWSYSFYALHTLGLLAATILAVHLDMPYWAGVGVLLAVAALASVLAAVPFYHLVERPGVAVGRRVLATMRAS